MKYYKFPIRVNHIITLLFIFILISSCQQKHTHKEVIEPVSIIGTWKLLTGTIIEGKDTTITNYTINQEVMKIINSTHFAFLRHDLNKDSIPIFVSGGGRCEIEKKKYTEHLDFCNFREWENNTFDFEFEIIGDTLITKGIERVESLKINRFNIEKYVRLK